MRELENSPNHLDAKTRSTLPRCCCDQQQRFGEVGRLKFSREESDGTMQIRWQNARNFFTQQTAIAFPVIFHGWKRGLFRFEWDKSNVGVVQSFRTVAWRGQIIALINYLCYVIFPFWIITGSSSTCCLFMNIFLTGIICTQESWTIEANVSPHKK